MTVTERDPDEACAAVWLYTSAPRPIGHAVELRRGEVTDTEWARYRPHALCGFTPVRGWVGKWWSDDGVSRRCTRCEALMARWPAGPERNVEARILTREWATDWPEGLYDDDTLVQVRVDGHLVAEVIVSEEDHHRGPRPRLTLRGVREQREHPEAPGFDVDVFPAGISHQGARIVQA